MEVGSGERANGSTESSGLGEDEEEEATGHRLPASSDDQDRAITIGLARRLPGNFFQGRRPDAGGIDLSETRTGDPPDDVPQMIAVPARRSGDAAGASITRIDAIAKAEPQVTLPMAAISVPGTGRTTRGLVLGAAAAVGVVGTVVAIRGVGGFHFQATFSATKPLFAP